MASLSVISCDIILYGGGGGGWGEEGRERERGGGGGGEGRDSLQHVYTSKFSNIIILIIVLFRADAVTLSHMYM